MTPRTNSGDMGNNNQGNQQPPPGSGGGKNPDDTKKNDDKQDDTKQAPELTENDIMLLHAEIICHVTYEWLQIGRWPDDVDEHAWMDAGKLPPQCRFAMLDKKVFTELLC